MHITIPRSILLPALERAASASDSKSTLPILGNVRLRAGANVLTLAATDLVLSVQASVPCTVTKPGAVCVPAGAMLKTVQAMPDGELEISVDAKFATTVSAGKRRVKLSGVPAEDYITLPDAPPGGTPISAQVLAGVLSRVAPCMSQDDARAHLCGALLVFDPGKVTAIATDGHRLAKSTCLAAECTVSVSMLIPARGVTAILAMVKGDTGNVLVSSAGAQSPVFVAREGLTLSSKLVDASFPSWEQVVPRGPFAHGVVVKRDGLLEALRVMSVVAADRASGVRLRMEGGLIVTSENPDTGDACEELDATVTGEPLLIGINGAYLVDALKVAPGADVAVECSGELDPVRVTVAGSEEWLAVVMPMRV